VTVLGGVLCAASALGALAGLARAAPHAALPVMGTGAFIVTIAAGVAALLR